MEILPCLFLAHIFFMNNTFPHIRTNLSFTHSFSSFPLPPTQDTLFSFGKPPWPFHELVPLAQWKFQNSPFQSMPSSSFKSQWELRMICPPIDFRMKIFGPNEIQKNSILQSNRMIIFMTNGIRGLILPLILDILMRFLSLIFILSVCWPSHPTSSS